VLSQSAPAGSSTEHKADKYQENVDCRGRVAGKEVADLLIDGAGRRANCEHRGKDRREYRSEEDSKRRPTEYNPKRARGREPVLSETQSVPSIASKERCRRDGNVFPQREALWYVYFVTSAVTCYTYSATQALKGSIGTRPSSMASQLRIVLRHRT
jgi:hypothetical protein